MQLSQQKGGYGFTSIPAQINSLSGLRSYAEAHLTSQCILAGASEENIRGLFQKAYRTAPSIVFIDEIDAIASKRENLQREMERRIVTQLMTCMDQFHQNIGPGGGDLDADSSEKKPGYVIVIGATNRPDAVDQALRRPGRFDREISLGVPDENARKQILKMLTQNLRLEGEFDLFKIARATPGFVGADLKALVDKAGNLAMKRIIDKRRAQYYHEHDGNSKHDWWRQPWDDGEVDGLHITMYDFEVMFEPFSCTAHVPEFCVSFIQPKLSLDYPQNLGILIHRHISPTQFSSVEFYQLPMDYHF
jgi:ribosome biogenesis ATPase